MQEFKTILEPQPALASALGIPKLFFKREDSHPLGSHKGRSIPFMIDFYRSRGSQSFSISSSGNAALAACRYISEINSDLKNEPLTLRVFVGKNINITKLAMLNEFSTKYITIEPVDRPLQNLAESIQNGFSSLRQSTDDNALVGYRSLASELLEVPQMKAVFVPTSSGTTALALGKMLIELGDKPKLFVAQTTECSPIASEFDTEIYEKEDSLADAIVDIVANRKDELVEIIKKTGGGGYIITNEEIEKTLEIVKKYAGIEISPNSALSVACLIKALENGLELTGSAVCLITGR